MGLSSFGTKAFIIVYNFHSLLGLMPAMGEGSIYFPLHCDSFERFKVTCPATERWRRLTGPLEQSKCLQHHLRPISVSFLLCRADLSTLLLAERFHVECLQHLQRTFVVLPVVEVSLDDWSMR
jgi:hypothetical protein